MPWVDIDYARSVVKQMYASDNWRIRVRSMSDEQVLAIYYKHEEMREAKRPRTIVSSEQKPQTCEKPKSLFAPYAGEQLSLDDILNQANT